MSSIDRLITDGAWSDLAHHREMPDIDFDRLRAYRTARLRAGMKTLRELGDHEWLRDHGYNDTPTKSEQKRYRDFENKYDIRWVGDLF